MSPARALSPRTDLGFEHVIQPGSGAMTLLLLHSTGGDEHQFVGLGRALAPEATLLSPRGKVLENGYIRRFFARRGPMELDIPDLLARTDELADFIASAATAYELDPSQMVALGYSNGANIAISMILRRPGLLAGAALLRPMLPYEPESAPALQGTDVLIAAGAHDPYSGGQTSQALTEVLRSGGAGVTLAVQDAGHELIEADIAETGRWLAGLTAERKP